MSKNNIFFKEFTRNLRFVSFQLSKLESSSFLVALSPVGLPHHSIEFLLVLPYSKVNPGYKNTLLGLIFSPVSRISFLSLLFAANIRLLL